MLDTQDKIIGNYTKMIVNGKIVVSADRREQTVSLIANLVKKKGYKFETFHSAVSIMDRYYFKLINDFKVDDAPNWV